MARTLSESTTLRNYLTVGVPFYTADSEVEILWWGTDPGGQAKQIKRAVFTQGSTKAVEGTDRRAVVGEELTPTLKSTALAVEGELMVRRAPMNLQRNSGGGWVLRVGSVLQDVSTLPYFTEIVVKVRYRPDSKTWPDFVVEALA